MYLLPTDGVFAGSEIVWLLQIPEAVSVDGEEGRHIVKCEPRNWKKRLRAVNMAMMM